MTASSRLEALARLHPEWAPWLHIVRELAPEFSNPAWNEQPAALAAREPSAPHLSPMLAGATLRPDGRAVARLLDRLRAVARSQGLHALAGNAPAAQDISAEDALALFLAAVNGDDEVLDRQASLVGAEPLKFRALAQLLPMPYLHACARRWSDSGSAPWSQGYCPVCGVWPALAEVRGIERARHLRCGRCGAGWPMPVLACTYCATTDHQMLATLVVDDRTSRFALDVCHACSGYLKSCTTLQATPSDELLALDLESVAFDVAAVERGFLRPPAAAVALRATLVQPGCAAPLAAPRGWRW